MVVDAAPKKFVTDPAEKTNSAINIDSLYKAPLIFGKDKILAQTLIYGRQLNPENQPESYISYEQEQEITRDALSKINIRVPSM